MIPEELCKEAQKQVKQEMARALYSYEWTKPEQGKMSIVRHQRMIDNEVWFVQEYLGVDWITNIGKS